MNAETKAGRVGATVVACLLVAAALSGAAAVWLAYRDPGAISRLAALNPTYRAEVEAGKIARQQESAFNGDPDIALPFADQEDATERVTEAQPGLRTEVIEYATSNFEKFGGERVDAKLKSDERVGPRQVTLVGIGLPGVEKSSGDAYVMFQQALEFEREPGVWDVAFVDTQVFRIALRGRVGDLEPYKGTAGTNYVSGVHGSIDEFHAWPTWAQNAVNEKESERAPVAGELPSTATSADSDQPAQEPQTERILAEQPGLDRAIAKAVLKRVKDSDFTFMDAAKYRQSQQTKLAGIARDGDRVDAYVLVVRRDPKADDPAYTTDHIAFRVKLVGEKGHYKVAEIVNGSEIIEDSAYAESTRWPLFVDEEISYLW